jgi:RNA polymerase sigma-70 factor (ECF subfamily)
VRAFSNLDAFRGEAQIGTWLARIVINEALACLRRRRPSMDTGSPALNAQIIPFPCANPEPDPETTMAQREIRALLERAIDELPEGTVKANKYRRFSASNPAGRVGDS